MQSTPLCGDKIAAFLNAGSGVSVFPIHEWRRN
jgi:hypothetical protein